MKKLSPSLIKNVIDVSKENTVQDIMSTLRNLSPSILKSEISEDKEWINVDSVTAETHMIMDEDLISVRRTKNNDSNSQDDVVTQEKVS